MSGPNPEDQKLARAVVLRLCPLAVNMTDAQLDADPICQWVACLFREVRDEVKGLGPAEVETTSQGNQKVMNEVNGPEYQRGYDAGYANAKDFAAADLPGKIRLARFEALSEAIAICEAVGRMRIGKMDAVANVASSIAQDIEDLRCAAKPREIPRRESPRNGGDSG